MGFAIRLKQLSIEEIEKAEISNPKYGIIVTKSFEMKDGMASKNEMC